MNRKEMMKRFRELAIADALGTGTQSDRAKLDRYQSLLREKETQSEAAWRARMEWHIRQLQKQVAREYRKAICLR